MAAVTVRVYEESTREENIEKYQVLDALLTVLQQILVCNDDLARELGEP